VNNNGTTVDPKTTKDGSQKPVVIQKTETQKPKIPLPSTAAATQTDNEKKRKVQDVSSDNYPTAKIQRSEQTLGVRFQRVDVSKTKFSNKKLADNSFASNSHEYGFKAAEELGKVKGDRFRHEKTKKKRGSYRGHISTEVKSIPLDSDGED